MRKKSGFTLTEVLMVITILAILAGLAAPNYFLTVEKSRSNEAIGNLNIIRMGERIYKLNNSRYWPNPDATDNTLSDINTNLNVSLDTPKYYALSITSTGTGTAFTATASRGNAGAKTFTIDQTGTITESGTY